MDKQTLIRAAELIEGSAFILLDSYTMHMDDGEKVWDDSDPEVKQMHESYDEHISMAKQIREFLDQLLNDFIEINRRLGQEQEKNANQKAMIEEEWAERDKIQNWLQNNLGFYDVARQASPVLALGAKRIWYHATDDVNSYPFDEVMEAAMEEPDRDSPPCEECGAMTLEEAQNKCFCGGDKDYCHGCELWLEEDDG